MLNNFFPENHAIYEIIWKNVVQPQRPQITMYVRRVKDAISLQDNQGKNAGTHSLCSVLFASTD